MVQVVRYEASQDVLPVDSVLFFSVEMEMVLLLEMNRLNTVRANQMKIIKNANHLPGTLASGMGLWPAESFLWCPGGGEVAGILALSTGDCAGGCFEGVKVGAEHHNDKRQLMNDNNCVDQEENKIEQIGMYRELERLQELHVLVPSQEICLAGEPKPLFQYSLVEAPTGVETMNWDYLVTTMVQVQ